MELERPRRDRGFLLLLVLSRLLLRGSGCGKILALLHHGSSQAGCEVLSCCRCYWRGGQILRVLQLHHRGCRSLGNSATARAAAAAGLMDGTTLHLVCISDKQHFLRGLSNFHLRIFFVFLLLLRLFRLTEIKPEQLSNHKVGIV